MILSIGFLLASCGERPLFDESHSFEERTWDQKEKAVFELNVEDTINAYYFDVQLRTTTDYAYKNMWVYLYTTAPDGTTAKEALRINIADNTGKWIGVKSGSMVNSKLRFSAKSFPLKGKYSFKMMQATNQEQLEEVVDIGLRVLPKE